MNPDILVNLYDIQTELDSNIGLISVIADGLDACCQEFALSDGKRYANALYIAFDTLSGTSEKIREQLDLAQKPGA